MRGWQRYRVISVDVVGRGKSDWLATKTGYGYPQYLNDMTTLLSAVCAKGQVMLLACGGCCCGHFCSSASLWLTLDLPLIHCQSVTWIGTSMGGLIGIMLAAQQNSPIKQLVSSFVRLLSFAVCRVLTVAATAWLGGERHWAVRLEGGHQPHCVLCGQGPQL